METVSIIIIAVIVILAITVIGLKLYISIKLKGLRQTAIDLIVEAEAAFDKGMNDEKFKAVFNGIYEKLPDRVKSFISEDTIKNFIQAIFDSIKSALDVNAKLPEDK